MAEQAEPFVQAPVEIPKEAVELVIWPFTRRDDGYDDMSGSSNERPSQKVRRRLGIWRKLSRENDDRWREDNITTNIRETSRY